MALIETKKLIKSYGDGELTVHALMDISLKIEQGEFVSIMGRSGSGKSTLMHILGFLDRPSSGFYEFDSKTIDDLNDDQLAHTRNKKMGFVFQVFNLLARASVLDNVKLPLMYSGTDPQSWDKIAKDAIESVGLSHRLTHTPSELSGGERQRVAIARALVNKPNVIFADEPTGNLDSKSGEQVMEVIFNLHKEGHTIVMVTHETYTSRYADRIITLLDGRITSDEIVSKQLKSHIHFSK
jgi:putative ABC transport system ATP-binding protein